MSDPGVSDATDQIETVVVTGVREKTIAPDPAVNGIPVYDPQIYIVLKKTVARKSVSGDGTSTSERFQKANKELDLTPYIGEDGAVVVSKNIREPAGTFSIDLADVMTPESMDSLYGLIEPMDVVEIRMAHNPARYNGKGLKKNMPIVMRGFVTDVTRNEAMGDDGHPRRSVSITGQDYGKLLQVQQISYQTNYVTGQRLLTYFKFFENYSDSNSPEQTANAFIEGVVKNVINAWISDLQAAGAGSSPVVNITAETSVENGIVAAFGTIQSYQGTVFDLMRTYGDVGPWNELFIEDREDGPFLVYRPTPFKDAQGAMIQGGKAPDVVAITDKDVVAMSVTRTDSGVYNYYWVEPMTYNLNTPGYAAIAAAGGAPAESFYLADYQNCTPKLYGLRKLEVSTQQGPRYDGKPEKDYTKTQMGDALDFTNLRRDVLLRNNRDNVLFEGGNIQSKGNEAIKAGMTVSLTRGRADPADYYAVGVQHIFRPYHSFTTNIVVERGTGFINRIQSGGAPYLKELNAGGVYEG